MRYLVLGCGAIGGTVAAGLVRDGHDVLVADADPAVVAAVNSAGLRITGPVEEFTVPVPAVLAADLPDKIDGPVLLAVKSHHTAAAAALLTGRLGGEPSASYVLSLQNGLNAQVIADAVGSGRVVEAFVNFGADVIEPGVVLRGNRGTFMIGELDGTLTDRVRALTAGHRRRRAHHRGARLPVGQGGLRGAAVRHRRQRPAHLRRLRRSGLPRAAAGRGPRGAGQGTGPAGGLRRLRPGRPGGLAGPAGRLQPGLGQDPLRRLPRPGHPAPAYRGARHPGPAVRRAADSPDRRAHRGHRARRPHLLPGPTWTCWPPTSAWSASADR